MADSSTFSSSRGGNGSMMIEAVPFFHILVNLITAEVGEDKVHATPILRSCTGCVF